MLVYPRVAVGMLHGTYLLTCWSASPKQVWSQCLVAWEPSFFLNARWHGEALYWLGVWPVGVLLISGGFFLFLLPRVAPDSQKDFQSTELTLSFFLPLVPILDPSWKILESHFGFFVCFLISTTLVKVQWYFACPLSIPSFGISTLQFVIKKPSFYS
jgi:hypothetical protein